MLLPAAWRMNSTWFCDRIVLLEGAGIVEEGSHEELEKQDGLYREFWNAQAQYYAEN